MCTLWRIPPRGSSRQHRNRIQSRMRRSTLLRRLLRNRVRTVDQFEVVNRKLSALDPICRVKNLLEQAKTLKGPW